MISLDTIKQFVSNEKPFLKQRFGVSSLGIFGSYVRGEANDESDIDLLVEFSLPVTLFDIVEMEEYLSDKLKIKVDVVMKKALRRRIGKKILDEVVAL